MLANYCARLRFKIPIPISLPVRNPFRTSWRRTFALRRVSMIYLTILHSDSNRPMPWMPIFPLRIRTVT